MQQDPCLDQNVGRRRIFWTTQVQPCGSYTVCGTECAIPGLEYEDHPNDERTIKTNDWLQSLILNILNTRARSDARCPSPAAVYGHWSESYRRDGLYIGSTLWNAAEKSYIRTSDAVKAIGAAVRADVSKLIALGLANSVEVEATYIKHGNVQVIVTAFTSAGQARINLSGQFVSETWVWN
jgi:phage gp46-like protein